MANGTAPRSLDDIDIQIEDDGCNNPSYTKTESVIVVGADVGCIKRSSSLTLKRDNSDPNIQTVLWQSVSLVVWPAIDAHSLIQQTVIRCVNGDKCKTATIETQTEFIGGDVATYMKLGQQSPDALQSRNTEVIL